MQLKEIMTRGIVNIPAQATCQQAARLMKEKEIGFLAVSSQDGNAIGVLTDRDIVVRCLGNNLGPDTEVEKVMSPEVHAVSQDIDVTEAAQIIEDRQIRRLLVIGDDQSLVGVVTMRDLAQGTHDAKLCGEIVERVTA